MSKKEASLLEKALVIVEHLTELELDALLNRATERHIELMSADSPQTVIVTLAKPKNAAEPF